MMAGTSGTLLRSRTLPLSGSGVDGPTYRSSPVLKVERFTLDGLLPHSSGKMSLICFDFPWKYRESAQSATCGPGSMMNVSRFHVVGFAASHSQNVLSHLAGHVCPQAVAPALPSSAPIRR